MVLKFILILLGIVLGLLLLLILLLLFCPVRYRAALAKESEEWKEIQADASVSWLCHLFSFRIWIQDGKLQKRIRVFGIPVLELLAFIRKQKERRKSREKSRDIEKNKNIEISKNTEQSRNTERSEKKEQSENKELIENKAQPGNKSKSEREEPVRGTEEPASGEADPLSGQASQFPKPEGHDENTTESEIESATENVTESEIESTTENVPESESESTAENVTESETESTTENVTGSEPESVTELNTESETDSVSGNEDQPDLKEAPADDKPARFYVFLQNFRNKLRHILEILKGIPERWQRVVEHAEERKRHLERQLHWWKKFLGHPRTKAAFSLIKKEITGLLRHICPTRLDGEVTFGCEDPATTGQALMILGITVPFHKNTIQVTPIFDGQNHLNGHVRMKGRLYGYRFVITSIKLYFNKNIRFVIRRWKKKEG
jgi:hypothetical protein